MSKYKKAGATDDSSVPIVVMSPLKRKLITEVKGRTNDALVFNSLSQQSSHQETKNSGLYQ